MHAPKKPLRALVVDDTILYRKILSDILNNISGVEVVGTAPNGKIALDKIERLAPDLITLDLEMPVLDGIATLQQLRAQSNPVKSLIVSAYSQVGAKVTLEALTLGAFDFITKPTDTNWKINQTNLDAQLRNKLASVLLANTFSTSSQTLPPSTSSTSPHIDIVAIGISTGGPKALSEIIPALPTNLPVPVVIVQHLPALFTTALAKSLNAQSAIQVQEGSHDQILQPGTIYLAPGGKQMGIVKTGLQTTLAITDDPPEHFCKPAVDYLFRSVAKIYGPNSLGIIMTGMGSDGAQGLKTLKEQGASTIAQDEATSVVYGMPREAVNVGAVNTILPLHKIADEIVRQCTQ